MTVPTFWILLCYAVIHCCRCHLQDQQQGQITIKPFTLNNHDFQTKYNLLNVAFLRHIKDEKEAAVLIMSVDS